MDQAIECSSYRNETLYGCYDASINRLCPHLREGSSSSTSSCSSSPLESDGLITPNVCDCQLNYYRNKCGQCVLLCDCKISCTVTLWDPCSDPNAERVACNEDYKTKVCRTCKDVLKGGYPKCKRCMRDKTSVCVCRLGFALDECGRCVTEEFCKSKTKCGCSCPCNIEEHQDWRCFSKCNERACEYLDKSIARRCTLDCRYDCDCAENYWRYTDPNKPDQSKTEKKCIPTNDCPQTS